MNIYIYLNVFLKVEINIIEIYDEIYKKQFILNRLLKVKFKQNYKR